MQVVNTRSDENGNEVTSVYHRISAQSDSESEHVYMAIYDSVRDCDSNNNMCTTQTKVYTCSGEGPLTDEKVHSRDETFRSPNGCDLLPGPCNFHPMIPLKVEDTDNIEPQFDKTCRHRRNSCSSNCWEPSLNRSENDSNTCSAYFSVRAVRAQSENTDTLPCTCSDTSDKPHVPHRHDIENTEIKSIEKCKNTPNRHSAQEMSSCHNNDFNFENAEGFGDGEQHSETTKPFNEQTELSERGRYFDLIRRCDGLINTLQRQNHDYQALRRIHARFRTVFLGQTVVNIVLLMGCVLAVTAYGVSRNEASEEYKAFMWELTHDVGVIKTDYRKVSAMVNDVLTRTTSVIHLTSDGQTNYHGNHYIVKWSGKGYYTKGSLTLSPSNDSVTIATGGFYAIYCKMQFAASLNETKDLKLGYGLFHLQQNSVVYITHAQRRYSAVKGEIRHDLPVQTTVYMQPGDKIFVRVQANQQSMLTKIHGAHNLDLFELR